MAASPSRRSKAHPIAAGIFHALLIEEEVERAYDLLLGEASRNQGRADEVKVGRIVWRAAYGDQFGKDGVHRW